MPQIIEYKENLTDSSIYNVIKDIANKYDDMFEIWYSSYNDLHNITNFVAILTEEGFCFTFNALNSHDIYTDEYVYDVK